MSLSGCFGIESCYSISEVTWFHLFYFTFHQLPMLWFVHVTRGTAYKIHRRITFWDREGQSQEKLGWNFEVWGFEIWVCTVLRIKIRPHLAKQACFKPSRILTEIGLLNDLPFHIFRKSCLEPWLRKELIQVGPILSRSLRPSFDSNCI